MGIRISVDPSWFIVLFLYIWLLSTGFKDVLPGHPNKAFALATASALLFFVSVVLHELGHAIVARRNGVEIDGITLWMFGGMAQFRAEMPSAGAEFRIAAAGPAVTVVIAAVCFGLAVLTSNFTDVHHAAGLKRGSNVPAGVMLLGWLSAINVFLLVINL